MAPWEDYLRRIYYNPSHPASDEGEKAVYNAVRRERKYKISHKQIRECDRCRGGSSAILLLYLVTAKLGGIPRRGPTTRLAALDAGRIPNRKGTSRCV